MQSTLTTLVWVLFCIPVIYAVQRQFRCDYTYVPEADGWFKYQEIPSNWYRARTRCFMEGAILASPLNPAIANAMIKILRAGYVDHQIFTGIHSTFSKGDYTSVEGVRLDQIPHIWKGHEADNFKDKEDCLTLAPDGTLADKPCNNTYNYLCFKPKTGSMVVTECGTIDPEYKLDKRTGSCYKFHRVPRSWVNAYMACYSEGGYLTIINSQIESTVIREIFAKNPPNSMPGNFWKDVAFVGFRDWTTQGAWTTINGETLEQAGFNTFSPGEPNNSTTGEFCGSVYRNGLFNDLWCYNRYAFVCEKDPNTLVCDD